MQNPFPAPPPINQNRLASLVLSISEVLSRVRGLAPGTVPLIGGGNRLYSRFFLFIGGGSCVIATR